jgi:hypothetical protein
MRVRALIAVFGASSVLALTGCGSSSPISSGAAGGSGGAGGSSGQAPTGTQSAPVKGKSIDVCAVLPAATASQITGTTLKTTKPNSVEGLIFGCDYGGPDGALLQISVDTANGKGDFDADIVALKTIQHPPTRISGVGDEAFSEPNPGGNAGSAGAAAFASYGAVFGDTYIKIGGLTYVTAAQGKQIVEMLNSKL